MLWVFVGSELGSDSRQNNDSQNQEDIIEDEEDYDDIDEEDFYEEESSDDDITFENFYEKYYNSESS
ncbi:hypothetical protein [Enterococcus alishanensis]